MGKKRITSTDLEWLISEELFVPKRDRSRASLAVVPDEKEGWTIVVGNRNRRYLRPADKRRLADIQHRLRAVYELWS